MVRNWRKQEDDLRKVKKSRQSFRGNKARWPQLEDKIEQWVTEQRAAGRSVSQVSIRLKAAAVARDMKINDFQGGPSWCFRFMKRRNLSVRTRTTASQQLLKDYEEKRAMSRTCRKNKITGKKIRPEHITNVDEVPLNFDVPVNRTVEKTGNDQHFCENEFFTDQHLCNQENHSSLKKEELEPLQIKEEQDEPELHQIKVEQEDTWTNLKIEQFEQKQEIAIVMATSISVENEHKEPNPNSEQPCCLTSAVTEKQDEEGSRHVDSGSAESEELKMKKRHLKTGCHHEESLFISHGSTSVNMDPPDSPASAGAPEAESTPMSATSPAPSASCASRSSAARRKRDNSIADLPSVMAQMHGDEMRLLERHHEEHKQHHQEYMQHLREVAADVRADAREAQEQDVALRREELAEMATFNRDFMTQFGRLVDALSSRCV
ncbi:uncharacterized protein KZ484_000034 [Pholidichthys leucotaenia]